jgi:hypothetical protein
MPKNIKMQPITTLEHKNCNKAYKPDYYMTTSFTIKNAKKPIYNHGAHELQPA